MSRKKMILTCVFCTLLFATLAIGQDLNVGDSAPAIDVEHWVSTADGQFKEVQEFEKGKIYVVEFWATWCGPCIASMPHLAELQEKHAEHGVQVISVSDEDLDTVNEFLEGTVGGEDELTYAKLTSAYCLTTDPDGSVQEDYLYAAGESGIPTAFIVGKSGEIEWIGHPMEMDEPLEDIIGDKWDRDAFVEQRAAQKAEEEKLLAEQMAAQRVIRPILEELGPMMEDGDFEDAIEYIDEKANENDNEFVADFLNEVRKQAVLAAGGEEAVKAFNEMVADADGDPEYLNEICWGIVEMHLGGVEVDKGLIDAAAEAAEMAVKSAPDDGMILDTLAHLVYLNGDLDRAIEIQKKALANGEGFEEELQPFLDELLAEKKEQSDKEEEKEEDKEEEDDK